MLFIGNFLKRWQSAPTVVKVAPDLAAPLYTLRKECAYRSTQLSERACLQRQMAEECFVQVQTLEHQLRYLKHYEGYEEQARELQARHFHLAQEGLSYQELAEETTALVENYNRTIIELHVCIYKVRTMNSTQALAKSSELLAAFEDRIRELESAQQGLESSFTPLLFPEVATI